jgi:hypothetical protein
MRNQPTERSAASLPYGADPAGFAAGEQADQADLVEEARAIVAGADIRPTRAHLWACLSWLDGYPLPMGEIARES